MGIAPSLHTERLGLRPFTAVDADELHTFFTEAGVRRYLLDDEVVPRVWVENEIEASTARFEAGGCGLWAVRLEGSETIVGFAGFRPFFDPPELQLLYGFLPSHWGRGFATEAASTVMRHAFEVLGFEEIRAATDAPNAASSRVLERLGLRERKRSDEGPAGTVYYQITRGGWERQRG